MKELSIEEKAKYYDEAIERVNSIWYYKDKPCFVNIVEIFPELKESEDEEIRKEILSFLREGKPYHCPDSIKRKKWIAWFEKQNKNELEKYINEERNKKDFYYAGDEVSWNEIPLNVREHDYPYYFNGDLDCYPFHVKKQGENKPVISDELFDHIQKLVER